MSDSCDPMDYSLPGSSAHGGPPPILRKSTGVGCQCLLQAYTLPYVYRQPMEIGPFAMEMTQGTQTGAQTQQPGGV